MSDGTPEGSTGDGLSFEGLDHIVALLADITDDDRHRIEPPSSVWNAIVDAVSADRDGRPDRALILTNNGNGSVAADLTAVVQQATTTISLAARRRPVEHPVLPTEMGAWRRQWLPVAAAVAVTIVGGLVTWAFSDELGGADGTGAAVELDGEVIAVAAITGAGLDDATGEPTERGEVGEARLIRSGDRHYLDLDLPDLPEVEGYIELWITDPSEQAMFSLGVVTGDGRYALPGNLDPASYPVVDVSVEPIDGDPTHSGQRLWRGELDL